MAIFLWVGCNASHVISVQMRPYVKCLESNSIGTRGNVKEGWKLTLMSSFDIEQGGVNSGPGGRGVLSNLEDSSIIAPEIVKRRAEKRSRSGCGQMDLASACVLQPLNCLVLDFVVWVRGWVNEQRSGGVPC